VGRFSLLTRRKGVGLAFTAYDIWRRLPPSQRRQLIEATRTHGPRLAADAAQRLSDQRKQRRRRKAKPRP
jgi:hypothetical protein